MNELQKLIERNKQQKKLVNELQQISAEIDRIGEELEELAEAIDGLRKTDTKNSLADCTDFQILTNTMQLVVEQIKTEKEE